MNLKDLLESSAETPQGSITDDLLYSKIWLVQTLKKLNKTNFNTIYVLGSWYSNMSIILDRLRISADKIVNFDSDKSHINIGEEIVADFDLQMPIDHIIKDVNLLNYKNLNNQSLIINTSVLDIDGTAWWDNIPTGITVVLQSRDNVENPPHKSLEDFENSFPMSSVLFKDTISLEDPETKYNRFMIIGTK